MYPVPLLRRETSEFPRSVLADGSDCEQLLFPCFHLNCPHKVVGGHYEYLDDLIRGSARCLAWGLHCVPRGGRANSPLACVRGDFSYPAFRDGQTDCIG